MAGAGDHHPAPLEFPVRRLRFSDIMDRARPDRRESFFGASSLKISASCLAWSTVEFRVVPDRVMAEIVLFGMEDGILDDEGQSVKLGKELAQGAQLEKLLKAERTAVGEKSRILNSSSLTRSTLR